MHRISQGSMKSIKYPAPGKKPQFFFCCVIASLFCHKWISEKRFRCQLVPRIWIEDSPPETGPLDLKTALPPSGHAAVGVSSAGAVGHRWLVPTWHGEPVGASWSYQLFSAAHDKLGGHFSFWNWRCGFFRKVWKCLLFNEPLEHAQYWDRCRRRSWHWLFYSWNQGLKHDSWSHSECVSSPSFSNRQNKDILEIQCGTSDIGPH